MVEKGTCTNIPKLLLTHNPTLITATKYIVITKMSAQWSSPLLCAIAVL